MQGRRQLGNRQGVIILTIAVLDAQARWTANLKVDPMPPSKRLGTHRLPSDVYGCVNQREIYDRDTVAFDTFIRQMRFDLLIAERIVVGDTHFIDGRFFALNDPTTLMNLLGRGLHIRDLPIEVRTRGTGNSGSRLAGTLRSFLLREDRDTLNRFSFRVLSDELVRQELQLNLEKTRSPVLIDRLRQVEDCDVPKVLTRFFKDLVGPSIADPEFDRLEDGWTKWIEAERSGLLRTAAWSPGRLPMQDALLKYLPLDPTVFSTDLGRSVHAEVMEVVRLSSYRSDFTQRLRRIRQSVVSGTGAAELADIDLIDRWHLTSRYIAEARHEGADVAYKFDLTNRPINELEKTASEVNLGQKMVDITIGAELVPGLGALDGDGYRRLVNRVEPNLRAVWDRGSPSDVRTLFEKIGETLSASAPRSARGDMSAILISAGVGVAGAVSGMNPVFTIISSAAAGFGPVVGEVVQRVRERQFRPKTGRILQYLQDRRPSAEKNGE